MKECLNTANVRNMSALLALPLPPARPPACASNKPPRPQTAAAAAEAARLRVELAEKAAAFAALQARTDRERAAGYDAAAATELAAQIVQLQARLEERDMHIHEVRRAGARPGCRHAPAPAAAACPSTYNAPAMTVASLRPRTPSPRAAPAPRPLRPQLERCLLQRPTPADFVSVAFEPVNGVGAASNDPRC
jgi:hypothetical protein